MKRLSNIKLHPAFIILVCSPLFWFLVVVLIYGILMAYWCSKLFSGDTNIKLEDVLVTGTGHKVAKRIWRKKRLNAIWMKIKPMAKK